MFTKRTLTGTVVAAGLSLATLQAAQAGVVDFTFTGAVGSWSYDSTSAQFTPPVPISGVLTLNLSDAAAAGASVEWTVNDVVSLKLNGYLAQENNPPYSPTNVYNDSMPVFYRNDANIATSAGGEDSGLVQPLVPGVVWEKQSYWELDDGTHGAAQFLGGAAYDANPFMDGGYLQINATIFRTDGPVGSYVYDQLYDLYLQLDSGTLTESLPYGDTNKSGGTNYTFGGSHTSDIAWQASPVPVPAALPLFLSALGLLGALRRSRAG